MEWFQFRIFYNTYDLVLKQCNNDESVQAWNLWKDDRSEELMDPTLANSCRVNELQLCIQVALLCVQENPEDRPAMSDIISMLGSDTRFLHAPKQPAFSTYMSMADIDSPRRLKKPSQISVTISALEAR